MGRRKGGGKKGGKRGRDGAQGGGRGSYVSVFDSPLMRLYYQMQGVYAAPLCVAGDGPPAHVVRPPLSEEEARSTQDVAMATFKLNLPASFRLNEAYNDVGSLRREVDALSAQTVDMPIVTPQGAAEMAAAVAAGQALDTNPREDPRAPGAQEQKADASEAEQPAPAGKVDAEGPTASMPVIEPLHWLPGLHAYQMAFDRRDIRRKPELAGVHKWLLTSSEAGRVTRQEAVSMIPPVVLDVQPHHKVLDMCAAPGSKTTQMLEIINRSENTLNPAGLVVANDANSDRAYMLAHRCGSAACSSLLVTCHEAQSLPRLRQMSLSRAERRTQETRQAEAAAQGGELPGLPGDFDRILCDVPCGGDGTARKNQRIWNDWDTIVGSGLHRLQLSIAERGYSLLKVGGYMVYSTCSLNPIENEAVVAQLLRAHDNLELVDPTQHVPGLKYRQGVATWKVIDTMCKRREAQRQAKIDRRAAKRQKTEQPSESSGPGEVAAEDNVQKEQEPEQPLEPEQETEGQGENGGKSGEPRRRLPCTEAEAREAVSVFETKEDVPLSARSRLVESMFPPTPEEARRMRLHLCMRIIPQDQNTGGFFIALLRKMRPHLAASGEPQDEAEAQVGPAQDRGDEVAVEGNGESGEDPAVPASAATAAAAAAATATNTSAGGDAEAAPAEAASEQVNPVMLSANARADRYVPFPPEKFASIRDFFGLSADIRPTQLVTRGETDKVVTYLPDCITDMLALDARGRYRVVRGGVKIFERNSSRGESESDYRILQHSLHKLIPFMSKRIVELSMDEFCAVLARSLEGDHASYTDLGEDAAAATLALSGGSFVFRTRDPSAAPNDRHATYALAAWRTKSNSTMRIMTNKEDRDILLFRLRMAGLLPSEDKSEATAEATASSSSSSS